MGKLQMCRICLADDVRLFEVDNKDIQQLYEALSNFPFVSEDSRPMLACVFCYTRLKQCCQLQRKCLEAEKLFTQMLNEDDEIKPLIKQGLIEITNTLIISPVVHINIIDDNEEETNNIDEIPFEFEEHCDNVHVKEEEETEYEPEYRYEEYVDNCPDVDDMPTNDPESDSEDDTPLIEFKTEVEEEVIQKIPRVTKKRSASDAKKPELNVRLTRQEDTMTFQQKKTKQTDSIISDTQKRSSTAGSNLVTNSKHTINSVKNTAISVNDQKYKYQCDICQHRYTRKYTLITHIRSHTGEKPYKCEICQKSFSQRRSLKRHYSRIHCGEDKEKQRNTVTAASELEKSVTSPSVANKNSSKEITNTKNGEKQHECDRCLFTTHSRKYFLLHIRTKHGQSYKCNICSRTYHQREKLIEHIRAHSGKKLYICDACPKSFLTGLGLKNHIINEHAGKKIYECDICKRGFALKKCLIAHIILHNEKTEERKDEKPFQCDVCGFRIKTKTQLTRHFLSHTKEKRLKCELCGRGFNLKEPFLNHMRRHNGDTCANYQCEKCGKGFTLRNSFRYHIRSSACWGRKNLMSCPVCQRGFPRSTSLKRHMLCHAKEKPYKCDECQSSFREKTKLVIHKRLHTGEKPFKCHLCAMSFRVKSSLSRHIYLHSGEKPYKCDECQRPFAHASDLKRHIQTHDQVKAFKCEFCSKSFTQSSSRNVHVLKAHQKRKQKVRKD